MITPLILLIFLAVPAFAGVAPDAVRWDTGILEWQWSQGTQGPANEFRVKCLEATTKTPLELKRYPISQFAAPVREMVPKIGSYECTITAAQVVPDVKFPQGRILAESPPSAPYFFDAGAVPSIAAPSGLRVREP